MAVISNEEAEWKLEARNSYAEAVERADEMAEDIIAGGGDTTSVRDFFLALYAYDLDEPQPRYASWSHPIIPGVFHSIAVMSDDAMDAQSAFAKIPGNLFRLDEQKRQHAVVPDYRDTLFWVPPTNETPVTYTLAKAGVTKTQPKFEAAEGYIGSGVLNAFKVQVNLRRGRVRTTPVEVPVIQNLWRAQGQPVYVGYELGNSYQLLPKTVGLTALVREVQNAWHGDDLDEAVQIGEIALAQLKLAEKQKT